MTCAELNERLVDYLYEELGGEERQRLEAHLVGCPACRGEVAGLSRTLGRARQALRGPLSEEAPARVRADIMQAARAALPRPAPTREPGPLAGLWAWLRKPWFLPALAAVSALAIFVIARPALMKPVPSSMPEGAPASQLASRPGIEPERPPVIEPSHAPSPAPSEGTQARAEAEEGDRAPAVRRPTRRYAVAPPTDDPSAHGPLALGGLGRPVKVVSDGSRPQPDEATMRRMEALARASAARKRELPRPAFRTATGGDPAPRAMPVAAPQVASAAELASAPRPSSASAPPAAPPPAPREVYDLQLATRPPPAELAAAPAAAADEDTTEGAVQSEEASGPRKLAAERKGRVGASMGNAAGGSPVASGAGSAVAARAEPEMRRDTATAKASAPAARAATARNFAAPPPAPASAPARPAMAEPVPASAPPVLSLAELRQRAERATRDGQHAEAAKHYRALLRRFPGHRDAPTWRRQLEAATRALR